MSGRHGSSRTYSLAEECSLRVDVLYCTTLEWLRAWSNVTWRFDSKASQMREWCSVAEVKEVSV